MTPRLACWVIGLALGVVVALLIPLTLFPGVRPLALGLVLLACGLLGEAVALLPRSRSATKDLPPVDLRPADGVIDLAPLRGVVAEPNPWEGRFRQFVRVDAAGPRTSRPLPNDPDTFPPLVGRIVLTSLFLGGDGRSWTDREIADGHAALVRAGLWLEREARSWDAPLNVELADTYFVAEGSEVDEVAIDYVPEGEDVGPMEADAEIKALYAITRAARELGFTDAVDLLGTIDARLIADRVAWLVHVRRRGRSLAVVRSVAGSLGLPGIGFAICYAREASFPEPLRGPGRIDPVTVVHELLHLFGATDKYGRSLGVYEPRTVTEREVMRLSETRLARLRVDGGTAREIGWVRAVADLANDEGRS